MGNKFTACSQPLAKISFLINFPTLEMTNQMNWTRLATKEDALDILTKGGDRSAFIEAFQIYFTGEKMKSVKGLSSKFVQRAFAMVKISK